MPISVILIVPLFLAALMQLIRRNRACGIANILGHGAVVIAALMLIRQVLETGTAAYLNFIYIDALSSFFIFVVALVSFSAALYSLQYISAEEEEGLIKRRKAPAYYSLFNLFAFTMFIGPCLNNLGFVWVAVEMTTLVSAFLVGFYNRKTSIEAAWKYVIICSAGIVLALLGIILFYYTVSLHAAVRTLNWTEMTAVSAQLDPRMVKIAFLFVLIGFGTKAGLAPMHNWLPDAHSQSPSPISALLSGVLLKIAFYAIIRFSVITNKCLGSASYTQHLFVVFGLLSLGIAASFILVQKDLKRLLAYSSVEHMGILCLGMGFGGWGVFGMLLHIFNHAATKSLMFFAGGNVTRAYRTNNMHLIKGVISVLPFTGVMLLLGMFALAGSPPFSIFISEIIILISGFLNGQYWVVGGALLFMTIIFAGITRHFGKLIFGKAPEGIVALKESPATRVSLAVLMVLICVMGVWIPPLAQDFLSSCARIIRGG